MHSEKKFDNLPFIVIEIDPEDLLIKYSNSAAFNAFGYNRNEIKKGFSFKSLIKNFNLDGQNNISEYVPDKNKTLIKIVNGNKTNFSLMIFKTSYKDSKELIRIIGYPFNLAKNKMLPQEHCLEKIFKIISEITQQQHESMNSQLMEKYLRMHLLISESSDEGIIIFDTQGNVVYTNPTTYKIYGEIMNKAENGKLKKFFINNAKIQIPLFEKVNFKGEIIQKKFDGTYFPAYINYGPLYAPDGSHIGYKLICKDITSVKKAVEALQREQDFSRNISENAKILITALDKDANILYCNRYCEAITGYSSMELIGKNWIDTICLKQDKHKIKEGFKHFFLGQLQRNSEYKIKSKDGNIRDILWNRVLLYENSQPKKILNIGIDITERKKAEEKIQEQNQHLNIINEIITLASSADSLEEFIPSSIERILNITNFSGGGIYLNDKNSSIAHLKFSKYLPVYFPKKIDRNCPNSNIFFKSNLQNRLICIKDLKKYTKGKYPYENMSMVSIPIFSNDNVIGTIILVSKNYIKQDETEIGVFESMALNIGATISRLLIKEELKESENRYRLLSENARDMIWKTDKNITISYISSSSKKILGYLPSEIIGKPYTEFMSEESIKTAQRIEKFCIKKQKLRDIPVFNIELIKKDKKKVTCEFLAVAEYDEEENLKFIQGIARDITERKKAETRLKKAIKRAITSEKKEKAQRKEAEKIARELRVANEDKRLTEEANKAKSQFLANISHEIRTPLNGVIGMTNLTLETSMNQQQKEYLMMIKNSAESLLDILNDILDLSRIESGKLNLYEEPFKIHKVIGTTLDSLAIKAYEKGLKLVYYIDPKVPYSLIGDSTRLRQVLLNLLGNAIKFTSQGEIILKVKTTKIKEKSVRLNFSVSDTGMGIPTEKINSIFNLFTQADQSHSRKYKGVGLGLAISKQIVEKMKGKIKVKSQLGKGSTFSFTIEFKKGKDIFKNKYLPLANKKILISEVNDNVRKLLLKTLKDYKMSCIEAEGDIEALYQIKKKPNNFDFVLLKPQSGGIDKKQMQQYIRNIDKKVKIIFLLDPLTDLQNSTSDEDILNLKSILKPVKYYELLDTLLDTLLEALAPVENPNINTKQKEDSNTEKLKKIKILVAEDNPVNQKLIGALLKKKNWQFTKCHNGIEVLETLKKNKFDIILMDLQMPEMDGFETTARIRNKQCHIPIIALTAHAMKGDREKCIKAGMDDYLSKPVTPNELYEKISSLIDKRLPYKLEKVEIFNEKTALFQAGGDKELMKEIVLLFIDNIPALIDNIKKSLQTNDIDLLKRHVHSLKGSSSMVGATQLHKSSMTAESECNKNSSDNLKTYINDLINNSNIFIKKIKNLWRV